MTLGQYFKKLEAHASVVEPPREDEYETFGRQILSLTITTVSEDFPAAASILRLISFLSNRAIPLELLTGTPEDSPGELFPVAQSVEVLNRELVRLIQLALVQRRGKALHIHPLVQATVRRLLTLEERRVWSLAALGTIHKALPPISAEGFSREIEAAYDQLVSHAAAAAFHSERAQVGAQVRLRVLNDIGIYCWIRGDYPHAIDFYRRGIKAHKEEEMDVGAELATVWSNLGRSLADAGALTNALSAFQQSISFSEATLGANDTSVARDLVNMGGVLSRLGEAVRAKEVLERALRIDEIALGPNHPEVAIDLGNLGKVLFDMELISDACRMFERALAIDENAYGPDHPNVASRCYSLGVVLNSKGDVSDAKMFLTRALEISCKHFGDHHPQVQMVREALAKLKRKMIRPA